MVEHTVEMDFAAAELERDLRLSPGYLEGNDSGESIPDWQGALEHNRVSDALRQQLLQLSEFFSDPVVYEAQRIYENSQLSAISFIQQRATAPGAARPATRKLVDLIAGISAALELGTAPGLRDWWTVVLAWRRTDFEEYSSYELLDSRATDESPQAWFMTVDHYCGRGEDDGLVVARWASGVDAERAVEVFSAMLESVGVSDVRVDVGSGDGVAELDADVPLAFRELANAVRSARMTEIEWLRVNSEPVDFYADTAGGIRHDPLVGVFSYSLSEHALKQLFESTSARYLFPVWLDGALGALKFLRQT
jgi:hypothetical protein